jgi:hypothetical protein
MSPFLQALLQGASGIAANAAGIDPAATSSPAMLGMALAGKGQAQTSQGQLQAQAQAPVTNNSTAPSEEPITITGDGWKPRKPNFWTFLGDVIGSHYGKGLIGTNTHTQEDLHDVMGDFASDPLKAIKRLQRIPGQEGKAVELYNQYEDNQRADLQAQALTEYRRAAQEDRARGVVAGMLGSVSDQQTYTKLLPTMRKYAEARGLDPNELPDDYDPDTLNAYRMGTVPVDKQIDNDRQDRNTQSQINYRNQSLGLRAQEVNNQTRNVNSEIGNRETRTGEYLRRGQETAAHDPAKLRANKTMRTAQGLVQFDKTGNKMRITAPDGRMFDYGIDPKTGHAVFIKKAEPVTPEE